MEHCAHPPDTSPPGGHNTVAARPAGQDSRDRYVPQTWGDSTSKTALIGHTTLNSLSINLSIINENAHKLDNT